MKLDRRTVLKTTAAAFGAGAVGWMPSVALAMPFTRAIPSTGEAIPLVGLGSWITFNVGNNQKLLDSCADVMAAFDYCQH